MAANDLSVSLTCLRVIRGWSRGDVARASGLPKEDVVDYESGEKVPDVKTAERLLAAMNFTVDVLHRVRRLVRAVGSLGPMGWMAEWPLPLPPEDSKYRNASRADLAWEVHRLAADAGKAVNGLAEMTLALMSNIPVVTKNAGD